MHDSRAHGYPTTPGDDGNGVIKYLPFVLVPEVVLCAPRKRLGTNTFVTNE